MRLYFLGRCCIKFGIRSWKLYVVETLRLKTFPGITTTPRLFSRYVINLFSSKSLVGIFLYSCWWYLRCWTWRIVEKQIMLIHSLQLLTVSEKEILIIPPLNNVNKHYSLKLHTNFQWIPVERNPISKEFHLLSYLLFGYDEVDKSNFPSFWNCNLEQLCYVLNLTYYPGIFIIFFA